MKIRLGIFPYTNDMNSIIKSDRMKNYSIKSLIVPTGWDMECSDQSINSENICDEESFIVNDGMKDLDEILFVKPIINIDEKMYIELRYIAKKNKVKIIYSYDFKKIVTNDKEENYESLECVQENILLVKKITSINVPVVAVMGLGQNCQKNGCAN